MLKLRLFQVEQRMCIHKETLTELDIYHRILRFNNYFIAMINKEVIPLKYNLPFLGKYTYLTRGLRFNIDMILFSGIGAPFKNNWHLKDEYKRFENRLQLADALSKRILYVGILNFILCPFIFIFQILRSFFHHAAILKKEPGFLGLRKWSHQGQVVLRHYNELDHEFRARLNRAYRSSTQYMSIFTSSLSAIIASHVTFICGSIVAVVGSLTIYDEDVIQVEYVIGLLTGSCFVIYACSSFIEKENLVWCPEVLMTKILSEVHYLPDAWKNKAHTTYVRNEFSELFQYKFVHLIESLLSPLITPFIFCFCMRSRALDIVDFLRNFTVEVIGVGDICSFAQMSLRKHGSRTWHPENFVLEDSLEVHDDATYSTDNGKTELSLLHFALTNPSWKPPQESEEYLNAFRVQARKDRNALPILNEENALSNSLNSVFGGNNPMQSRWLQTSRAFSQNACVNVSHLEGSNQGPSSGIFGSLSHDMYFDNQMPKKACDPVTSFLPPMQPQDMVALDMSISTLYLRELHQRQRCAANYTDTPINMAGNYFSDAGWARSHDVRSNESYYHSTDPPLAEGSYHPSQLNPIPDASDSAEGNSSQIFKENTPLLNPRT
ncbi:UNVERIFIED_CONTAM: hypothetical protein GTU68_037453 [Idotea baltica]|nr:hypothetical protein [Idotea baltica]